MDKTLYGETLLNWQDRVSPFSISTINNLVEGRVASGFSTGCLLQAPANKFLTGSKNMTQHCHVLFVKLLTV